jgi:hypothetical protein
LRSEPCVRPASRRRLSRGRWLPRRRLSWWRVTWRWAFPQQRGRRRIPRRWRIQGRWGRTLRRPLQQQECASRIFRRAPAEGWRLV